MQYKLIYRGIITLCLISSAFIIIAPPIFVARHLYIQQTLIFLSVIYDAIIIVRALLKGKKSAIWIAAVLGILAGFALHDTLISQWVISGTLLLLYNL